MSMTYINDDIRSGHVDAVLIREEDSQVVGSVADTRYSAMASRVINQIDESAACPSPLAPTMIWPKDPHTHLLVCRSEGTLRQRVNFRA
jgi:hypothetical protein